MPAARQAACSAEGMTATSSPPPAVNHVVLVAATTVAPATTESAAVFKGCLQSALAAAVEPYVGPPAPTGADTAISGPASVLVGSVAPTQLANEATPATAAVEVASPHPACRRAPVIASRADALPDAAPPLSDAPPVVATVPAPAVLAPTIPNATAGANVATTVGREASDEKARAAAAPASVSLATIAHCESAVPTPALAAAPAPGPGAVVHTQLGRNGPPPAVGTRQPGVRIVMREEAASPPIDDATPDPAGNGEALLPAAAAHGPATPAQPLGTVPRSSLQSSFPASKQPVVTAPTSVAAAQPESVGNVIAEPVWPDPSAITAVTRQLAAVASPLVRAAVPGPPNLSPIDRLGRPVPLPPANGAITVHLTPATLGAVTVAITRDADGLTVAIAAARPEALTSLRADRHSLQAVLDQATGGTAHVRVTLSALAHHDNQATATPMMSDAPRLHAGLETGFGADRQHRPGNGGFAHANTTRNDSVEAVVAVVATAIDERGGIDITA